MPSQSKSGGDKLQSFVTVAKQQARQLRATIYKARNFRREAVRLGTGHEAAATAESSPGGGTPRAADEHQAKARKATATACRQLGEILNLKRRIEICLLSSDDRTRPVREALEKLSFGTVSPTSGRWPSTTSFDEDGVLEALDTFERMLDVIPLSNSPDATEPQLAGTLKNGQFCDQVIDEVRRIRHLYLASTMVQIRSDHPNFLVWSIIEHPDTDAEDRDIFFHPNRCGPVVGYAVKLLARHFGKSEETIRRWRKAYRRLKTRSALAPA